MAFSTFKTIIEKACDYNVSNGNHQLNVIFHGGEPLLWGYDNFILAMSLEEKLIEKYPNFIFKNSIQTNGFLLDDRWIDFLSENKFDIGVSIDGPETINFHRGKNSNETVRKNIQKLSQKNCNFGILSVITNDHAGMADKYYDFLVENDIHSVGFCYCIYDENTHTTVSNKILTDFLKKFFVRFFEGEYTLRVREFDNIFKLCLGHPTNSCTYARRQRCGNFLSIRTNGDVYFCDPYTFNTPPIGNIINETFSAIKSKPELLRIITLAKESVLKKCKNCSIKDICGGGCYRHTWEDGENAFCETFKSIYPYIRSFVNEYKNRKDI